MFKRIFSLFLMLSFLFVAACSEDSSSSNDDGNNNNNTDGSFTADINGTSWSANTAVVATSNAGVLTVTGQYTDNSGLSQQMQVVIMQGAAVGTFNIALIGGQATGRYTTNSSSDPLDIKTYLATSGTLTITELSESSVKGTVSFDAPLNGSDQSDVKSITNGSFESKINL